MNGKMQIGRFVIAQEPEGVRLWDTSPQSFDPAGIVIAAPLSLVVKAARESFDFWCMNAVRDCAGMRLGRLQALRNHRRFRKADGWKIGDGWRVRAGRKEAPQLALSFRAEPFALRSEIAPAAPKKPAQPDAANQLTFNL